MTTKEKCDLVTRKLLSNVEKNILLRLQEEEQDLLETLDVETIYRLTNTAYSHIMSLRGDASIGEGILEAKLILKLE